MKVLQLNVMATRSTGRIACNLVRLLEQRGHAGCVAFARGPAPTGIPSLRIGSDWDVKIHGALSRLTDRAGFYSAAATRGLIEEIQAYRPDILHLHNLHGYYLHLPTLFAYLKSAKIPVIWTLHDCWAFTGHCPYYEMAHCDRWKTGCHHCPQKTEYPKSLLMDQSARNYHQKSELFCGVSALTLVTPSQWLADQVTQSFLKDYPLRVIPNGIDLDAFQPTPSTLRARYGLERKRILLSVANTWWEPRKGLPDLLELANRMGDDFQVVVLGVTEKLKRYLPGNILGLTRTENVRELAQWYTAADVCVSFSREETMGLTLPESLACGTQALCYQAAALPEALTDDVGMTVPTGDLNAAEQAIRLLCAAPKNADV
ncbi:MAG: glycosyltransferase, partial [Clostridia bacterium]|nr:glycosyltransferase [Clostridia bacterium]